ASCRLPGPSSERPARPRADPRRRPRQSRSGRAGRRSRSSSFGSSRRDYRAGRRLPRRWPPRWFECITRLAYAPRVSASPDFSSAQSLDREFPVRKSLIYFNHSAVAPLPRRVAAAIAAHNENVRDRGAADWRRWYAAIEATRAKAARFLGAAREEIAFLPNTSWGLNLVARSFPWKEGDNVVTDDMEFPSNAYPWLALGNRGVECRLPRSGGGGVTAEDIAAKVDARTRIVAVSWVAFHNGWVYPLEEISKVCRERGILFVLDAIQGLGALPIDVRVAGGGAPPRPHPQGRPRAGGGTRLFVVPTARPRAPPPRAPLWGG